MKITIYNSGSPEPEIRLALQSDGNNGVKLVAVDEKGVKLPSGHIMTFKSDGTTGNMIAIQAYGVDVPGLARQNGYIKVIAG